MAQPVFYNMDKWIQANKGSFTPPVCNKMMHNSQLSVFFVGGPNLRKDFHLEGGEELFYMVKGSMQLRVLSQGKFQDLTINEGEIFLLPSCIPHSPQRAADTIGMVIERERKPSEYDSIRWYVNDSKDVLFERWFHMIDLGSQLVPIIQEFQASEQCKTGHPVPGTITKDAPFRADEGRKLENPFPLRSWIEQHKAEIQEKGYKRLFDDSYQSDVTVFGPGGQDGSTGLHETFIWQINGSRIIHMHGKQYELDAGDTLLIPSDAEYHSRGSENGYSLFVTMNPHENMKF